jgi:hypothetical protein
MKGAGAPRPYTAPARLVCRCCHPPADNSPGSPPARARRRRPIHSTYAPIRVSRSADCAIAPASAALGMTRNCCRMKSRDTFSAKAARLPSHTSWRCSGRYRPRTETRPGRATPAPSARSRRGRSIPRARHTSAQGARSAPIRLYRIDAGGSYRAYPCPPRRLPSENTVCAQRI